MRLVIQENLVISSKQETGFSQLLQRYNNFMQTNSFVQISDRITLYWSKSFISNFMIKNNISEAATRGVLCKKTFLEISQNSQENTCARVSFLIKFQASNVQRFATCYLADQPYYAIITHDWYLHNRRSLHNVGSDMDYRYQVTSADFLSNIKEMKKH